MPTPYDADSALATGATPTLVYQDLIANVFPDQVRKRSFDAIGPTGQILGDRRSEVAREIEGLARQFGPGVAALVLHQQQLRSGHIPTSIPHKGGTVNLARPTESLVGQHGERILHAPVRRYRADLDALARLGIVKERQFTDASRLVSHERDGAICFLCSCHELNPAEVVIHMDGRELGLSRPYCCGFTFAPFGCPTTATHFLAWDGSTDPQDMTLTPSAVADLVMLTHHINASVAAFFADTGVEEFPYADGMANGWAGYTIWHSHFQFRTSEYPPPILFESLVPRRLAGARHDVRVQRLGWTPPIFRVNAEQPATVSRVTGALAWKWTQMSHGKDAPYKKRFARDYEFDESDRVPVHTANVYVPGADLGTTAFLILRDLRKVDYQPPHAEFVNRRARRRAQPKTNCGVLETVGAMLVDDPEQFDAMRDWTPSDVTAQFRLMGAAISPDDADIAEFENAVENVLVAATSRVGRRPLVRGPRPPSGRLTR